MASIIIYSYLFLFVVQSKASLVHILQNIKPVKTKQNKTASMVKFAGHGELLNWGETEKINVMLKFLA